MSKIKSELGNFGSFQGTFSFLFFTDLWNWIGGLIFLLDAKIGAECISMSYSKRPFSNAIDGVALENFSQRQDQRLPLSFRLSCVSFLLQCHISSSHFPLLLIMFLSHLFLQPVLLSPGNQILGGLGVALSTLETEHFTRQMSFFVGQW